jgi:4-amino-4-deoxy-L-arabinose transferase-like glycosyltransferase
MRLLGVALLVFAYAPLHRLMDTSGEARYREIAVSVADSALAFGIWGSVLTVLCALVLAVLMPTQRLRSAVSHIASRLESVPLGAYALGLAAVAAALATVVLRYLYLGLLTNVDEMASTLHARYLAEGMLGGPMLGLAEFWLIPNTLMVADGLVSQYPPTHLLAMAGAHVLGAPLFVGPVFFAATVALVTLSLPRLLPERSGAARVAALLLALCPLLLFLSGGLLNHTTTAAALAAALYAALRAEVGSGWWSLPAGVAVGLAVADRPLTGLVLGTVFTLGVWGPRLRDLPSPIRWLSTRCAGTVVGGAPIAVLLGWYNRRLFGSPATLGYLAAFGERHGLGFHQDPWGYPYQWTEALAFTSADMITAGVQLMETPFPLAALMGAYFLFGRRYPARIGLLLSWAFLPVVANAAYWFHTARMLYEAAPAWLALCTLAAVDLSRPAADSGSDRYGALARDMVAWGLVVIALGSIGWGVPARWSSFEWDDETLARITVPPAPIADAAVVFVHASWNERTSSILQGAAAMRQDSIITALRRNTSCGLHLYAAAREERVRFGREVPLPVVDLEQVAGSPPGIEVPPLRAGSTVRIRDGEPFPETCLRELASDRFGTVALAPLVWQGDLPGIERGLPVFVRDLGPERNRAVLDLYPERTPFVFTPTAVDAAPELVPYAEAMTLLWSGSDTQPSPPAD